MEEKLISKVVDDGFSLTEAQKQLIINRCKEPGTPPSIKELCILVLGHGTDGRDKRARLIREFCGTLGKELRVSYQYYKQSDDITFSPEQEQFIKKHASEMSATEIAKILWANPDIVNLDHRARAVKKYLESNMEEKK